MIWLRPDHRDFLSHGGGDEDVTIVARRQRRIRPNRILFAKYKKLQDSIEKNQEYDKMKQYLKWSSVVIMRCVSIDVRVKTDERS